jgi:hypothetical protein
MIGESHAWLNPRRPVFFAPMRAAGSSTRPGDRAFSIGVPVGFVFINYSAVDPVGTSSPRPFRRPTGALDGADSLFSPAPSVSNF